MNDQYKLNLINKYRNNPVAFIEDMYPEIKLYPYQKTFLNAMMSKQEDLYYVSPYMANKIWLSNMRLEIMKLMGMNFTVLSPSGRDDYEKSILVKTEKYKKEDKK